MTVKYKEYPQDKLIEIEVSGKITRQDFDLITQKMIKFIGAHGEIKLLEVVKDFKGFDPSLIWDGIKFDVKHMKYYKKCAIVFNMGWVGPFTKAIDFVISCQLRSFALREISKARDWLKESKQF